MCAVLLNQTDLKFSFRVNQQKGAIGTTVICSVWEQSHTLKVKSEEKLQRWLVLHHTAFMV